jgi:hypothetical protein
VAYGQAITASGGTGSPPLAYTITSGAIPTGLTFFAQNNQLLITGTPTATGTVSLSVTATDAVGSNATQQYTLTINPAVSLSPDSLPASTVGVSYSQAITASGGTGDKAVTYTIASVTQPADLGLSFTSSNNQLAIIGTPTASGTVSFSVTASDAVGAIANQSYTLVVYPALTLNPKTIPADIVGTAYSQAITAAGGVGNKTMTYKVTPGTLPAGLAITAKTNELDITGTPTASGTVSLSVTATDATGDFATRSYTLTVNPVNVTDQVNSTASGLVYNRATQLFGGTITLTNTGTTTLNGMLEVVLTGLPSGVTLSNASGYTADGNPYILVSLPNNKLAPGASVTFTVRFANPKRVLFGYTLGIFDEDTPG